MQNSTQNLYFKETPTSILSIPMERKLFRYFPELNQKIFTFLLYFFYFIVVLSWLMLAFSIIQRSLMGIEAMFVLQFAFVIFLYNSGIYQYPYHSLLALKYSTGINLLLNENSLETSTSSPYLLKNKMDILFEQNFNLMFLFLIVPPILCIYFYYQYKKAKKYVKKPKSFWFENEYND